MNRGARVVLAAGVVGAVAVLAWRATRDAGDAPTPREPARAAPADPERVLRGRVLDPFGAPVRGARIEARRGALQGVDHRDPAEWWMREGTPVASFTTEDDGAFALELPRARAHDLRVRAAGFAVEDVEDVYAGQVVTVSLHAKSGLAGRVVRAE